MSDKLLMKRLVTVILEPGPALSLLLKYGLICESKIINYFDMNEPAWVRLILNKY